MKPTIHDLAAQAAVALRAIAARRTRRPREPHEIVRVVEVRCRVCGRIHRMGLGSPRCFEPAPGPLAVPPPFSFSVAALVMAVASLALSGCALAPKVDANYRGRVDSFSMPVGIVWTGGVLTVGIAPAWHYRLPEAASSPAILQHTTK